MRPPYVDEWIYRRAVEEGRDIADIITEEEGRHGRVLHGCTQCAGSGLHYRDTELVGDCTKCDGSGYEEITLHEPDDLIV